MPGKAEMHGSVLVLDRSLKVLQQALQRGLTGRNEVNGVRLLISLSELLNHLHMIDLLLDQVIQREGLLKQDLHREVIDHHHEVILREDGLVPHLLDHLVQDPVSGQVSKTLGLLFHFN